MNDGKSDLWDFTVQFEPPVITEPQVFFPLTISWSPAHAGGSPVSYRIRIADNPDFTDAYVQTGVVMTSFIYPDDAPPLLPGLPWFFEIQTTDDTGIPLGTPVQISFQIPAVEVSLASPPSDSQLPMMMPVFEWTGNSMFYIVTLSAETSDWTYSSGPVQGTRWVYDGALLVRGARYRWTVTPSNQFGDGIGAASELWTFTLPAEGQVTVVSPVNQTVDTIFPTFTWDKVSAPGGETVSY
jgi:hypothetical protein